MNKKILYIAIGGLVLLIVLVVILVLTNTNNKKKNAETTLVFWNLNDDQSVFESVISEFQIANPKVKIEYVKKDPSTYLNDVLEAIAKGNGPDVLAFPNDWLPKYHSLLSPMPDGTLADKKNKKSDIDTYKSTFVKVVCDDNIIDQKIYGVPIGAETLTLYYNPDIFDQAASELQKKDSELLDSLRRSFNNGPANWNEFTNLVQAISTSSGKDVSRSAVSLGTSGVTRSVDILTLMMLQNGTKMTTDDHTAALFQTNQNTIPEFSGLSQPGATALELYTSFANPESKNYTWNESFGNSVRAFAEGKTAMLIDYPSAEKEIKRINPDLSYKSVNIPQAKESPAPINFASYLTYGVNRNSQNTSLAWDFISSITNGDTSQQYISETKKTPVKLEQLDKDSPLSTAESWYKPDPEKANTIFKDAMNQVLEGQSAQTALDGAAAQITNLLGVL